jgi:starvation-inducible DNA-binding protein
MQELVDLSLTGKQLHWAVVRPVHEQLDELVASWRDLADVVAERAVALGYVPDGQARAVAGEAPHAPVNHDRHADRRADAELPRLRDERSRGRALGTAPPPWTAALPDPPAQCVASSRS